MTASLKSCWALLLGMGVMMLGNGLQGSLLGLRAGIEGFDTSTTGVVMTGYFVGFLVGSQIVPIFVRRVGHVRVFAALASVASIAVLLHAVFLHPIGWALMRVVTGLSYAGLYIVAESWLNDKGTNETRGQLLSIYMVVQLGCMAIGQLFLNLADPAGFLLFILISVLVSFALVPILLTASPAPQFDQTTSLRLRDLYKLSPLGVVGSLLIGTAHSSMFGMGAVYGANAGLSLSQISIFMAAMLLGGMAWQWPVGWLSDKFDRRRVITFVAIAAAAAAYCGVFVSGQWVVALYVVGALLGGLSMPLYSLCLAHTNDYLEQSQMVAASSGLVMVMGIGACFGPFTSALAMEGMGPAGFFWYIGLVHTLIGAFALYRMRQRAAVPMEEQGPHIPLSPRASHFVAAVASAQVRDHLESAEEEPEAISGEVQPS